MNDSAKNVVYARFQTSLYIPGIGEVGNTLPASGKAIYDLSMIYEDGLLSISGSRAIGSKNVPFNLGVPSANISIMAFDGTNMPPLSIKVA